MTVRQIPQPSDVFATRTHDRGGADSLHGVVLIARRDEPPQSAATDLSNVVPFARPRRQDVTVAFPLPAVSEDDRSLPLAAKLGIVGGLACIAASLLVHGGLLAMFWQEPKPMASIGIEVMTVEITLGATTAAGLAPTPGEQETQPVAPSEQPTQDEPVTEQSRATTVMSQEVPVAAFETAPEVKREETPADVQTAEPQEQTPETAITETATATRQEEKPPERTEQPRPQQVTAAQTAPERKRIAAPTDKKTTQKKQRAAATPSTAASGIGRGRSDNSANYNGMVAAHLARHKQYPASARSAGAQGIATVTFSIDGNGRVTAARLAAGSGNPAIDQEVVAMARRASPFPSPPDGRGRNFTVPVRFNLR
jgi:protein TonB